MAHQVTAYLKTHHDETWRRIAREITADLPGLTTTERLDLGRRALEEDKSASE
jgi:hypothetical protein